MHTISIMSQITVHPSINHILKVIKSNITHEILDSDQMSHFEYRTAIIGFIEVLLRKLNLENHLVKLLFDGEDKSRDLENFLPFQILMIFFKKERMQD